MMPRQVKDALQHVHDSWVRDEEEYPSAIAVRRAIEQVDRSSERGTLTVPQRIGSPRVFDNTWGFAIAPEVPLRFTDVEPDRDLRPGDTVDVHGYFGWASEADGPFNEGDLREASLVAKLRRRTLTPNGDVDAATVRDPEADTWVDGDEPFPDNRVFIQWHLDFAPLVDAEPSYHVTFGGAALPGERPLYHNETPRLPRVPTSPFDFVLGLEVVAANFLGRLYTRRLRRESEWRTALRTSEHSVLGPFLQRSLRRLRSPAEGWTSQYEQWERPLRGRL